MRKGLFWLAGGLLAWTHAGYPLAAAAAGRLRPRRVQKDEATPTVTAIVAAHDEEDVIARRVENLLALDYPPERLDVIVASDDSSDRTEEIVEEISEREPRVRLLRCPRGGKVAAQDRAVREAESEIVAFSDANALWAVGALRQLVRSFADPEVAYVCGQLRLEEPNGTSREGAYWRYEVWLREQESALGSITGGNGAIYALRRSDYLEVDPRFGHDLSLPYTLTQRGRRAVYEPKAVASEQPTPDQEDEYRRKVRMFEHCWAIVLEGRFLAGGGPLYLAQLVSHRILRYGSGVLHAVLLGTTVALAGRGRAYDTALAAQLAFLGLAAAGRLRVPLPGAALAYYYFLVTSATLVSLVRYLRSGVPAVWEKAPGTR